MIKRALLTLSLLIFGMACIAAEDAPKTYVAGTDYDLISPPVRAVDPGKIEVAEFFWYGCSHCYTFEPLLQAWKKKLPKDGRCSLAEVFKVPRQDEATPK